MDCLGFCKVVQVIFGGSAPRLEIGLCHWPWNRLGCTINYTRGWLWKEWAVLLLLPCFLNQCHPFIRSSESISDKALGFPNAAITRDVGDHGDLLCPTRHFSISVANK